MNTLSPADIMSVSPIIPVIAIDDADHAVDLAHALMDGGIKVLEITLRTPAALASIKKISAAIPDAVVGAGTVLTTDDLSNVIDAGASFAISPGSTPKLLKTAQAEKFPLLPGVATASEIMQGMDLGYNHFKLFPAVTAGGVGALKSFSGPFPQARFCPTGGISMTNMNEFLTLENVICVGGSWIAPQALVQTGNFAEITHITAKSLKELK
ncbi:MAG: Keto-deoxy-phosphogluconate aldolase [uncultured Thiotrichaceae bacterium]|uniref:2-dehydro-3-deoxy-phosphogluconate aldolase n=1 Tax=uncultured Thiotrichaceae bacterium TaxID=298394 RepID=A0A6S6TYQ5_9GAMM|nr:MAG: Keto-deoxy-phosphogluconate aldolase [uncultured Thiotrichaceae bacterium]